MASILIVCTGNVCRSPIAEAALRAALTERFGNRAPAVSSAGTAGWEGSGAVGGSVEAAAERGHDIGDHVARMLTPAMVGDADLVLCMAAEHRDAIRSIASERAFTLKELVRLLEELPSAAGADPEALAGRVAEAAAARRSGAATNPWDEDIVDPLGLSMEAIRAVAWEIDQWIERLVAGLYDPSPARRVL
jgi:protein-tyrosine phosphatase